MTPYQTLLQESDKIGWPLRFKTDLTNHDRRRLEGDDPPKKFIWVLRALGTDLLDFRMQLSSAQGYSRHYFSSKSDDRASQNRFYFWTSKRLVKVTRDTAMSTLLAAARRVTDTDNAYGVY